MSTAERSVEKARQHMKIDPALLAAHAIMADCLDRGGVKQALLSCEPDVYKGILHTWENIINLCLKENRDE